MLTYKIVVAYQGTRYEGWQSQRKGNTVQEHIEKALSRIASARVTVLGCSRTDSGVHAEGLVAHFKAELTLTPTRLKQALNHILPPDIQVRRVSIAPSGFHARYGARSKVYRYQIWTGRDKPLFEAPYWLWYHGRLDVMAMRKAARYLVGRHDFAAFKDAGDDKKDTTRTVKALRIHKDGQKVVIRIEGDGFLTHMVRIIVGTLIDVGRGRKFSGDVQRILVSKDRRQAGSTSKALGLFLEKVRY